MRDDKSLWKAYCRKRFNCKPLIDDENGLPCLRVAYDIGYKDAKRDVK